jgi:hypothetical protein
MNTFTVHSPRSDDSVTVTALPTSGYVTVRAVEWRQERGRTVPVTVEVDVPFEELLEQLLAMAVRLVGSDEADAAAAAFGVTVERRP